MPTVKKIYDAVMSGSQDKNIRFQDLQKLLKSIGFSERIRGDHFIYTKDGVKDIINIQPLNGRAKPYQVKQVRNIIFEYKIFEV